MSTLTRRLSSAVLGVSLTAGLTAGLALPAAAQPTSPPASVSAQASALADAAQAVTEAVQVRLYDANGKLIPLPDSWLWSTLVPATSQDPAEVDESDWVDEDEDWDEEEWDDEYDLTDEEWDEVDALLEAYEADPTITLTPEQIDLLERAGYMENGEWIEWDEGEDVGWVELTDAEVAMLEDILATLAANPFADLTAEQMALLEKVGLAEVADPFYGMSEDEIAYLKEYGQTTCLYAGTTFVGTLWDMTTGAMPTDPGLEDVLDWSVVMGTTDCSALTPEQLAAPESARLEISMGDTTMTLRLVVTDESLAGEVGTQPAPVPPVIEDATPSAGEDHAAPSPAQPVADDADHSGAPTGDHTVPTRVETGAEAAWWLAALAALGGAALVRYRRAFGVGA